MKIFKCIFSDDELASDIYPVNEIDGVVYELTGKQITMKEGGIDPSLLGSNPSEEEAGEEMEEGSISGINVCLGHRLVETGYTKKDYTKYIKEYMKRVKAKLEEKGDAAQVEAFQKGCQSFIKTMFAEFGEYQFFTGESMDVDGMVVLVKWKGETPYVYLFKHGLIEEKV